jgi:hypothetical protein
VPAFVEAVEAMTATSRAFLGCFTALAGLVDLAGFTEDAAARSERRVTTSEEEELATESIGLGFSSELDVPNGAKV